MDSRGKFAVALGLVILVVDLLWLYNASSAGFGAHVPYRNFTVNASAAYPGFNGTGGGAAFRAGGGYSGFIDIVFGAIILVADLIWLYLEVSRPKAAAAKPKAKK